MSTDLFEKGYYVAPKVLSEHQRSLVDGALPEVDSAGTRLLLGLEFFSQLARRLKSEPVLASNLKGLCAVQCILFDKSSGRNWSVQTHRDTVIPMQGFGPWPSAGLKEGLESVRPPFEFLCKCLAVRVALDECEDADLEVYPQTHRSVDLEPENPDLVVVPKGGALVLRPALLHRSKKLVRSESRRVLHYLFAPVTPPHNYRWYHVQ